MDSQGTLLADLNRTWSTYWQDEPLGLDITSNTTIFKFRYFLKPVLDRLPLNSSVCEIGCGNCQWLLLVKSYRPDLKLWGMDISDEAERLANLYGIGFFREDIRNVSLESDSFDFTFSWGVIEHMPESAQALSEQVRISKLATVADVPYKYALSTLPLYREIKRKNISAYDAMVKFGKFYSKKSFKEMVQGANVNSKFHVQYKNNYLIFPQNKIGRILEYLSPDWFRSFFGHNVGAIFIKRESNVS